MKKATEFYLFGGPDGCGGGSLIEAIDLKDALSKYEDERSVELIPAQTGEHDTWVAKLVDLSYLKPFQKKTGVVNHAAFAEHLVYLDTLQYDDDEKWEFRNAFESLGKSYRCRSEKDDLDDETAELMAEMMSS